MNKKKIRQKKSITINFLNYDPSNKTESTIHEKFVRVKITKKNTIKIMSVKITIKNKSKGNNKF
jgi:hypothetical protein